MKEGWVIITEELSGAIVPAWWESNDEDNLDRPVLYETKREAYLEVVDLLKHRIETFLEDETMDCPGIDDDMVIPCNITDSGIITTAYGELFSPFKPQSDYGR